MTHSEIYSAELKILKQYVLGFFSSAFVFTGTSHAAAGMFIYPSWAASRAGMLVSGVDFIIYIFV